MPGVHTVCSVDYSIILMRHPSLKVSTFASIAKSVHCKLMIVVDPGFLSTFHTLFCVEYKEN